MVKPEESTYIAVRLSPTMRSQLAKQAARHGVKGTELIRTLLINYLDQHARKEEEAIDERESMRPK
jgi:hypothetical protein